MSSARARARRVALLLGLPALAAAVGCDGRAGAGGGRDSVYIAVAASMAGGGNRAYFDGVHLAVDHLNQARPAGSRPFGVRAPNSAALTQVAIAAAFRDDPAVIGVVGHTGSAQTLEAAPI